MKKIRCSTMLIAVMCLLTFVGCSGEDSVSSGLSDATNDKLSSDQTETSTSGSSGDLSETTSGSTGSSSSSSKSTSGSTSSSSSSSSLAGTYWCMGKGDTCQNKTYNALDLFCDKCDPNGDNKEG